MVAHLNYTDTLKSELNAGNARENISTAHLCRSNYTADQIAPYKHWARYVRLVWQLRALVVKMLNQFIIM